MNVLRVVALFLILFTPLKAAVSERLMARVAHECGVPLKILRAICEVESGFNAYAINVQGRPHHFKEKGEAAAFLKSVLASGIDNVDVGCMQINWRWHGSQMDSPQSLLDEETCLRYGASLLRRLAIEKRGWIQGALYYHSASRSAQAVYLKKLKTVLQEV